MAQEGQPRYLKLPDGSYLEIPPGVTDEEISAKKAKLIEMHPEWASSDPAPTPEPTPEPVVQEQPQRQGLGQRVGDAALNAAGSFINPIGATREALGGVGDMVLDATQQNRFSNPAAREYVENPNIGTGAKLGASVAADTATKVGGGFAGGALKMGEAVLTNPVNAVKDLITGIVNEAGTAATTVDEAGKLWEEGDKLGALNRAGRGIEATGNTVMLGSFAGRGKTIGAAKRSRPLSANELQRVDNRVQSGKVGSAEQVNAKTTALRRQDKGTETPYGDLPPERSYPEGSAIRRNRFEQAAEDTKTTGVELPLAGKDTLGSLGTLQLANSLPIVRGFTTKAIEKFANKVEANFNEFVTNFSREKKKVIASQEDAGAAVLEATKRYMLDREQSFFSGGKRIKNENAGKYKTFRDVQDSMREKAYNAIGEEGINAPTLVDNMRKELGMFREQTANPKLLESLKKDNPVLAEVEGILKQNEPLTFSDLYAIRTKLRNAQNEATITPGKSDAWYGRMVSAATKDIHAHAERFGGQTALNRLRAADSHYKKSLKRMKRAFKGILDKTDDKIAPELAFHRIIGFMKGGNSGPGSIGKIRMLRRALKPEEMEAVAQAVMKELGKNKEGVWTPETFIKNWKTLDAKSRHEFFRRVKDPTRVERIQAWVRTIEEMAQLRGTLPNITGQARGSALSFLGTAINPMIYLRFMATVGTFGAAVLSPAFTKFYTAIASSPRRGLRYLEKLEQEGMINKQTVDRYMSMTKHERHRLAMSAAIFGWAISDEADADEAAMLIPMMAEADENGGEFKLPTDAKGSNLKEARQPLPDGNMQLEDARDAQYSDPAQEPQYQSLRAAQPPGQ